MAQMLIQMFVFTLLPPTMISSKVPTNVFTVLNATLTYQLLYIDYEWTNVAAKTGAITSGDYIVENNIITGVKVYGDSVYVTVPRWRPGVPACLNKLVPGTDTEVVLRPFPSWDMNKKGDCSALQYVHSMEIDPNTGYMWIIDTGRVNTLSSVTPAENLCPAKIIILNIATETIVRSYEFPDDVVSRTSNFMNDIVLDYVDGVARYAYITDTSDGKLYVYDYLLNDSYYFEDESMKKDIRSRAPVDGIAMSSDFRYVYYCTLSSKALYAVPTHVLRDKSADFHGNRVFVGNRTDGSDGLAFGQKSLFFGGLDNNAVYMVTAKGQGQVVSLATEELLFSDSEFAQWVDTFAFNGTDLWFVANKLSLFLNNDLDFSGGDKNMYIWKLEVGEHGYLWNAPSRTRFWTSWVPGIFG